MQPRTLPFSHVIPASASPLMQVRGSGRCHVSATAAVDQCTSEPVACSARASVTEAGIRGRTGRGLEVLAMHIRQGKGLDALCKSCSGLRLL